MKKRSKESKSEGGGNRQRDWRESQGGSRWGRGESVEHTGDVEELGSLVALATKRGEPVTTTSADGGRHCHCLDVVHRRRTPKETHISGEWRF